MHVDGCAKTTFVQHPRLPMIVGWQNYIKRQPQDVHHGESELSLAALSAEP